MANHTSHAALPYPVRKARYTIFVPYRASTGIPTDPTTPDTEVSLDGAAFGDCTEEVSTISGSNGFGYITLTGAETDAAMVALAAKVASGPLTTLEILLPRSLPVLATGTLTAGAAGGGTLGITGYSVIGCILRTTGGTGGGGTGGANNQARVIKTYTASTGAFTVEPNWETTPDATTTYDLLLTEYATNTPESRAIKPGTDGRTINVDSSGNVTVVTNNDKTGYELSSTGLAAIWDRLTSAITTVGSIGKLIKDNLDTTVSSRMATFTLPTNFSSLVIDSSGRIQIQYGTSTGQISATAGVVAASGNWSVVGDAMNINSTGLAAIWDRLTSAITTTGSIGKLIKDNLDTTISSRMATFSLPTNFSSLAIDGSGFLTLVSAYDPAKTAAQVSDIPSSSTNADSVWNRLLTSITTVGSIGKLIKDNLDTNIGSRMATFVYTTPPTVVQIRQEMDSNSTRLDANISSRMATFTLPTNFSSLAIDGSGKLMLVSSYDPAKTASQLTTSDIPTVSQIATAVWNTLTSSLTTSGSIGKYILDNLPFTVPTVAQIWDALLSTMNTVGSVGKRIKDNLDAKVSEVSGGGGGGFTFPGARDVTVTTKDDSDNFLQNVAVRIELDSDAELHVNGTNSSFHTSLDDLTYHFTATRRGFQFTPEDITISSENTEVTLILTQTSIPNAQEPDSTNCFFYTTDESDVVTPNITVHWEIVPDITNPAPINIAYMSGQSKSDSDGLWTHEFKRGITIRYWTNINNKKEFDIPADAAGSTELPVV